MTDLAIAVAHPARLAAPSGSAGSGGSDTAATADPAGRDFDRILLRSSAGSHRGGGPASDPSNRAEPTGVGPTAEEPEPGPEPAPVEAEVPDAATLPPPVPGTVPPAPVPSGANAAELTGAPTPPEASPAAIDAVPATAEPVAAAPVSTGRLQAPTSAADQPTTADQVGSAGPAPQATPAEAEGPRPTGSPTAAPTATTTTATGTPEAPAEATASPTASAPLDRWARRTGAPDAEPEPAAPPAPAPAPAPSAAPTTTDLVGGAAPAPSAVTATVPTPLAPPPAPTAATTAAPAAPLPGAEPPAAWEQVHHAVGTLRQLRDGSQQIRVRLHPEELGEVLVELTTHAGQLRINLVTETAAARERLNAELSQLAAKLGESGLDASSLDVGTRQRDGRGGDDRGAGPVTPGSTMRRERTIGIDLGALTIGSGRPVRAGGARLDLAL